MIDLHAHVLPLDDGARSFDEAVEMCRLASKNGIRKIVCTPHIISPGYNIDIHKILFSMKKLQGLLKKEHIDIKLIQGAENYIGNNITINKTNYILVEFPIMDVPVFAEGIIREYLQNYNVIIAHPEKNKQIQDDHEILVKFVKLGCYVQLDADSFLSMGVRKRTAVEFVERNMVHFIATDMHRPEDAVTLKKAVEYVKHIAPNAMDFVTTNPEKVIAGKKI